MNTNTIQLTKTDKNQKSLTLLVILCMIIWGVSWPSAKILSRYGSAESIAFIRFIMVFFSMLILLIWKKVDLKISLKGIPFILISGFFLALYNYVFLQGLNHGYSGAGGILVSTLNPIMAYSFGSLIARKKPSKKESAGLILGLIAGAILLRVWTSVDEIFSTGNTFFLLAALIWVFLSKATATATKYGTSLGFILWVYLATTFFLVFLIEPAEFTAMIQRADQLYWWNLFFFAVITTTVATSIYFYATTEMGPEKASSFIFLVPVIVGFSAWIILDETLELHTIIGGFLGVIAVYLINRKTKTPNSSFNVKN